MNDSTQVAIIAAMEREIKPLIRDWTVNLAHSRRVYEKGHVVLVVSGIGERSAAEAADRLFGFRQPEVILSVGLAGALDPAMPVGTVVVPTKVLRQSTGETFTIAGGEGTLVTVARVATPGEKRELAMEYGAHVVDMEAAAVADVARKRGVRFAAVKAVSDELTFSLPSFDSFVDDDGRFHTGRFIAHAAFRPQLWPVLSRLRTNADTASRALCAVLSQIGSASDVERLLQAREIRAS